MGLNKNIAIQGEFIGPKINGNMMQLTDYDFMVFNVKDLDTGKYYGCDELINFCNNELKVKMVPILERFIHVKDWNMKKFQEYANSVKYTTPMNKTVMAEGIVIRPCIYTYSCILGKMLSTKIIIRIIKINQMYFQMYRLYIETHHHLQTYYK
jgi:hypothetical protein